MNNGGTTWTYNQGVILGGLAALHELTGDRGYLRQGEAIADAALRSLTSAGRASSPSRARPRPPPTTVTCRSSRASSSATCRTSRGTAGKPAYGAFLLANADSVLASDRNAAGQFGLRWAGPFDRADASRQTSAVEVLIAAAAGRPHGL